MDRPGLVDIEGLEHGLLVDELAGGVLEVGRVVRGIERAPAHRIGAPDRNSGSGRSGRGCSSAAGWRCSAASVAGRLFSLPGSMARPHLPAVFGLRFRMLLANAWACSSNQKKAEHPTE